MSKCSTKDCKHHVDRKDRKRKIKKIKAIGKEKTELEARMEDCESSLDEIEDFKEKNKVPEKVGRALSRGEEELMEERYMICSEMFDLTQKVAQCLKEIMEIDKAATDCCKKQKFS